MGCFQPDLSVTFFPCFSLCTTEILHQEFECHRSSKDDGLKCLRRQLTGDELLTWTIETFTMFYPKSFAQKNIMPLFDLVPLFVSFSTFVYDYYSGNGGSQSVYGFEKCPELATYFVNFFALISTWHFICAHGAYDLYWHAACPGG